MPTFLDTIPDDVHNTIAKHLFSTISLHPCKRNLNRYEIIDDQNLNTLLQYAMNGPVKQNAVLTAMCKRLYIPEHWREQSVLNWISVSASQLLELNLLDAPGFSFPGTLPKLPKLRRAAIDVLPAHLSLIHGSPQLAELEVLITRTCQWQRLVSTISSLPLRRLFLIFSLPAERLQPNNLSKNQLMTLCAACPTVDDFSLIPGHRMTSDAWDMIQGLRALKRLTLISASTGNIIIEDRYVTFVQSLQELALKSSEGIQHIERFSTVISGLYLFRHVLNSEQILRFASFINLRKLGLVLRDGAESALIGVVDNVEELSLSWRFNNERYPHDGPHGNDDEWVYPIYYMPNATVLEKILRSTTNLKSLMISDAILYSAVIKRILKIVGTSLEDFAVCHDWQREAVPTRMKCILNAITRYCPKLKTLNSVENHCSSPFFILATDEETKQCFRALEEALHQLPRLGSYMKIRSILQTRFTVDRPENTLLWDDIVLRF